MSAILITGWSGFDHAEMAAHTMPLMRQYADRHGMQKYCACLSGERPPSWMKVLYLIEALEHYEQVLWLDADVVIVNQEENILDAVPAGVAHAVVEHDTERGPVPNCGVWVVNREMRPYLIAAWNSDRFVNHCWWEQAAIVTQMGYEVTADQNGLPLCRAGLETDLRKKTAFLPPTWNHHHADRRRAQQPNFLHITGYENRVNALIRLCNAAQT